MSAPTPRTMTKILSALHVLHAAKKAFLEYFLLRKISPAHFSCTNGHLCALADMKV